MSDKHPTRRHGGSVPSSADIAPWPDERGAQQAREFDRRCREAYAMLKLMKEGALDHAGPEIAAWFARVQQLEK